MRNLRLGIEALVAALSLAMMVSWKTGTMAWIDWLPGKSPMLFNTGLVLFLISLAGMSFRLHKVQMSRVVSVGALLLALMTLLQYFIYTPWEIDQLFHDTPVHWNPLHPGRMALNSALSFTLLSFSFLLRTIPGYSRGASWAITLAFAVATVSFGGYVFNLGTAYGWGGIAPMAPVTASSIFLLTLVNWNLTLDEAAEKVAIALVTLTVLLAFGIFHSENELIKQRIKSVIARDQILFERSLHERETSLKRLANRSANPLLKPELWQRDTEQYILDFADIWRIYYVERSGAVQLRSKNAPAQVPVELPLETVFTTKSPKIFLDLNSQGHLFWFIVPADNGRGAVVSLHETQSFLESVVGRLWSSQEVFIDGRRVISTLSKGQEQTPQDWGAEFRTQYAGTEWKIRSYPKADDLSSNVGQITIVLVCAGILLSIVAYLMIKFYADTQRTLENEHRAKLELELLLDFVPVGLFRTNALGECVWVNHRWTAKSGLSEHEARGNGWQRAIHPDDRLLVFQEWEASIRERRPFDLVYRFLHSDGRVIWVHGRTVAIRKELYELKGYIGSVVDVTAERGIQQELRDQQLNAIYADKMKAVGELATGITYELDNPLAVTQGTVEMLELMLEQKKLTDKALGDALQKILAMTQRSMRVVKNLREFTRDGKQTPMYPCRVNTLISGALDLCAARFKSHGVDIRIKDLGEDREVLCRPTDIEQVLFNLLTNSFDAILGVENPWIEINLSERNGKVQFCVSNNGPAIPSEVVDRLMDPFFSSKDKSVHAGLGLSIARSIVQAHGGDLVILAREPHPKFSFELKLA